MTNNIHLLLGGIPFAGFMLLLLVLTFRSVLMVFESIVWWIGGNYGR